MRPDIIVICGPTASGKSELAVGLAKRLGGEVVSADSMQVYRRMDIGTAKPTRREMDGVPHHMIDVADPEENYSVSRYVEQAIPVVDGILARGGCPIVCGGTGLYIDALVAGRDFAPLPKDPEFRTRLYARSAAGELPALLEQLRSVDPEAAARLHPNDEKRILRALEVWFVTGKTITAYNEATKKLPPRYTPLTIVLSFRDRALLKQRIDLRVDDMMARGLEREVRSLLDGGLSPGCTAMQAIGYKELAAALSEGRSAAEAAGEIKLRSRQYARRQLSWFRRAQDAHWLYRDDFPIFSDAVSFSTKIARSAGL